MADDTGKKDQAAASKEAALPKDETLRKLIEQLMAQKKEVSRFSDKPKPIEEYKFWKTQPVLKFEQGNVVQGPFENKKVEDIPTTPQKLPEGFEWCTLDVNTDLEDLYELLYSNYVEDDDEQFRFKYSVPFLKWALTPPGWNPDFAVGIRATESKKLLAFISGIPSELIVRDQPITSVEINFLCVHKKLRSKRMAPVLIKEVTRRVNLTNVWQALFTAGTLIPTPVATARYYHRVINWSKLYDVGFASLPSGSTRAQEVARSAFSSTIDLEGFRDFEEKDVKPVQKLLGDYLKKFELHQQFSEEEVRHWFSPGPDGSVPSMGYVVESTSDGKITDFISAYGLETSVLGQTKHDTINIAYSFYYATTATGKDLQPRLEKLFKALLVKVKAKGYDVLNALTVMDNPLILEPLNFKPGDGLLNYNLFNWKTPPISGGVDDAKNLSQPGGIGVILL